MLGALWRPTLVAPGKCMRMVRPERHVNVRQVALKRKAARPGSQPR